MGARLPHRGLDAGTCFWPLAWSKSPRPRRSEMPRLRVGVWRARRPAAHAAHVFVLNSRVRPPPAPRPPRQCTLSGLSSPLARDRVGRPRGGLCRAAVCRPRRLRCDSALGSTQCVCGSSVTQCQRRRRSAREKLLNLY